MTLVAIVGGLGSGKTLTLTFLAFKQFLKARKVFSNYKLKFPFIPTRNIGDIDAMQAGFFAGDELWAWIDSRASKHVKNMVIAGILLKSRKRDLDIVYTAQSFMQMDKRVRNVTDFIVYPELNKSETKCTAYWYEKNTMESPNPRPLSFSRFNTAPFFKLYDTNEEIAPLTDDEK